MRQQWHGQRYVLYDYPDYGPNAETVYFRQASGFEAIDVVIEEYQDVFGKGNGADSFGYCDLIPFTIDTGDARPIRQRPYRVPLAKRKVIEDQIQDMLRDGIIEPSTSPWASPITLVPKGDSWWFCVDYRKLNAVTKKDSYPLPLIQDIFDRLEGTAIFFTLDLKSRYWQIPVAKEDRPKTAFVCPSNRLFQFRRLSFGLANGPTIFQRTMDRVLQGLIGRCCYVYIDDIVIYSHNLGEHVQHLRLVLERLRHFGLKVKPSKCAFAKKEVQLLGYIIFAAGIRSNPDKIQAIASMQPPHDKKAVRAFLGMAGYCRARNPNFAAVAAPLTALTRKNARWKWADEHMQAFHTLQKLPQSDNVLAYPQTDKPYKLYTDACDYAITGILVQEDGAGLERVVQYVSHQLTEAQRKWCTTEKEAYAIVFFLNKLRAYLWGGAQFEIITDHKPLRSLFLSEVANTKVKLRAILIAEFGAPIRYIEGKRNIRADMLSRIRPREIDVVDTGSYVELQTGTVTWSLPLKFDGISKEELSRNQQAEFADLWPEAQDPDNDTYNVQDEILYSRKRPGPRQAQYQRVLLLRRWRDTVVDRCHEQTGHAVI